MHDAIALLSELGQGNIDWIFDTGVTQQVNANEVIIKEGKDPDALYFVLEGVVGIYVSSLGDEQLTVLGPGEILGEMSFLEDRPASASVVTLENSLLLALPRDKLQAKLKEDSDFAARLYKSFATLASKRLRERVGTLSSMIQAKAADKYATTGVWQRISNAIQNFKGLIEMADREALKSDGVVPPELAQKMEAEFENFWDYINSEIGDESPENVYVKEDLGARLRREILPYLLLTKTTERCYSKPRGYAGDFLTIEYIYQNRPGGSGRLGPLVDRCFLNMPVGRAVRNRRGLLAQEINQVIAQKEGSTARITSLACGPAEEIFDVFDQIDDPSRLMVTLIDMDLQALAFVSDRRDKKKLKRQMKLINANLVYLATGRERMDVKDQDLVYSVGLIDYFDDKFVITLLNYVYQLLRSGGKVILGNFHPRNPAKALMDYVLDWRLVHRTEEDMNRLFASSAFKGRCTDIQSEKEGINLFAACIKP